MAKETIKGKDMTEFTGPVDTGDPHANRKADRKKNGDMEPDTSVAKAGLKGPELPGTVDVSEEVKKLFRGVDGLDEDFINKAATLFEVSVNDKARQLTQQIKENYDSELENAYDQLKEELSTKIDEYFTTLAEEYFQQNQLVIESQFDAEVSKSIVESVSDIVAYAGLRLPEEQVDVANSLAEENESLKESYNNLFESYTNLNREVDVYKRNEILEGKTRVLGLSEAEKDNIAKLADDISYKSLEDFGSKLDTIIESVSSKVANKPSMENLTEQSKHKEPAIEQDNDISLLANTISRFKF